MPGVGRTWSALGDTAQAGDDDRADRPVPGYFDFDLSLAADDAKGLAGLEAGESVAYAHAALAEVNQVSVKFVGPTVRGERDFDLAFRRQAWFAAAIGKDRGVGGDQFNPVSLITHGLKQHNAGPQDIAKHVRNVWRLDRSNLGFRRSG